jgi:tetratricopeptide (TPR) repeat protein
MKNFVSLLLIMMVLAFRYTGNCSPDDADAKKQVKKAFELRMNGKVDEAKSLLENILANDSTVAMAHYEMARIKHYMLIGGNGVKIDDILASINKAVIYEPKNVIYSYYKAIVSFLNAFMAMQQGQDVVKSYIAETCNQFEKVLNLDPDYYEARLYLIEIYGMLPPNMGGDSLKAVVQVEKLANANAYYGAKAKAVFANESTDQVKYWKGILALDSKNPELMKEVGKAYLYNDDPVNAEKYFDEAIRLNPSNNILILDLARYHMMKVMQNKDMAVKELPLAKIFLEKYLKSIPTPIIPLKAYTIGLQARIDMILGNQPDVEKLVAEAKSLDNYFSRASGIPTLLLFDPPDKISHNYFSFFSPF